jgi:hypothetical protein
MESSEFMRVELRRVPRSMDHAIVRIKVKVEGDQWATLSHQCWKIETATRIAKAARLCGVWLERAISVARKIDCGEPHNYPGMRSGTCEDKIERWEQLEEIREH